VCSSDLAVALETLKIYEEMDIVSRVRAISPALQNGLKDFAGHEIVGEVRGVGLIAAVELVQDKSSRAPFDPKQGVGANMVKRMQENGLIGRNLGDAIAFAPPLVISEADIGEMLDRFARALDETTKWVQSGQ